MTTENNPINYEDMRAIYDSVAKSFNVIKNIDDRALFSLFYPEYVELTELKHKFFTLEYMLTKAMERLINAEKERD
jgi:hypothetical protein